MNFLYGFLDYSEGKHRLHQDDTISVEYLMNSDGYRSDEFSKETSREVVLSVGCSFTFGAGLPFKNTWPLVLQGMLGLTANANIAIPGLSPNIMINNVYTYVREYGKPRAVTILLPNLQRYYNITQTDKTVHVKPQLFHHLSPNRVDSVIQTKQDLDFVNKLMTKENLAYDLVHRLIQLEEYLFAIGVPLVYTAWAPEVVNILEEQTQLKNFFPISQDERKQYLFDNKDGYSNEEEQLLWDEAADRPNAHPGISENRFFAELFYRELKERYDI